MTLDEFLAEVTLVFGKPKSVSRKVLEDYPDLKVVTVTDYQPHRGEKSIYQMNMKSSAGGQQKHMLETV